MPTFPAPGQSEARNPHPRPLPLSSHFPISSFTIPPNCSLLQSALQSHIDLPVANCMSKAIASSCCYSTSILCCYSSSILEPEYSVHHSTSYHHPAKPDPRNQQLISVSSLISTTNRAHNLAQVGFVQNKGFCVCRLRPLGGKEGEVDSPSGTAPRLWRLQHL